MRWNKFLVIIIVVIQEILSWDNLKLWKVTPPQEGSASSYFLEIRHIQVPIQKISDNAKTMLEKSDNIYFEIDFKNPKNIKDVKRLFLGSKKSIKGEITNYAYKLLKDYFNSQRQERSFFERLFGPLDFFEKNWKNMIPSCLGKSQKVTLIA